jgi:hypothetical protein
MKDRIKINISKDANNIKSANFYNAIAIYVLNQQLKSGVIPSNDDGSFDPWDFIESITALNFIFKQEEAKKSFRWLKANQNEDGSWFSKYSSSGEPIETNKPTHFSSYISVGLLHYYKTFSDLDFLEEMWPSLKKATNFSIKHQTQKGTIPWSIDSKGDIENDYLITASSSILKSLECASAIEKILNLDLNPDWIMAYELLSNALRHPKGLFDLQKDRSNFSMDSYYPVISGCLNKNEIEEAIQQTLNNFYEDGLGIKCVREEPWITVAETNEFVIALVIGNKKDLAKKILLESTLISDKNNIPYMGWQYKEKIFWPNEKPTWTAAAMLLAADAVFGYTSAADLFLKNQLDSF